jgi:DNA-binding helix-turn-helix protein
MINAGKIKGKMVEMQITQRDVADKLEIAQSTLNLKINNRRPMNLNEAEKICELLNISANEFGEYFFE